MPVGPTLSVFLCPCFFDWGYTVRSINDVKQQEKP